jgi:hypothetical protein
MCFPDGQVRVFLYGAPVDMRKPADDEDEGALFWTILSTYSWVQVPFLNSQNWGRRGPVCLIVDPGKGVDVRAR